MDLQDHQAQQALKVHREIKAAWDHVAPKETQDQQDLLVKVEALVSQVPMDPTDFQDPEDQKDNAVNQVGHGKSVRN